MASSNSRHCCVAGFFHRQAPFNDITQHASHFLLQAATSWCVFSGAATHLCLQSVLTNLRWQAHKRVSMAADVDCSSSLATLAGQLRPTATLLPSCSAKVYLMVKNCCCQRGCGGWQAHQIMLYLGRESQGCINVGSMCSVKEQKFFGQHLYLALPETC